ncbi:MAG: purine-nucleoside phosphorylase [Bryobacterales bacterium]|nr:purine-nucleoside phosphorylase [Bryobacterales bacterium]
MTDLEETVATVRGHLPKIPKMAIVLGSGLGVFADELSHRGEIPYSDLPHWPRSTAVGHAGKLILGQLGDLDLLCLSGRAHLYEGYTPREAAFAIRVLGMLGVRSLVLTNAAGGINPAFEQGELVLISDHINLQGVNPLVGPNDDALGPRFPDMSEAYCEHYRYITKLVAAELHITVAEGVYAALLGPSYETPAEIRYLRAIGADLVGMSTVPEVIAANHMGMKVLAISCVTNMAAGMLPRKIDHEEVLETGAKVRDTLLRLLKKVLPRLEA